MAISNERLDSIYKDIFGPTQGTARDITDQSPAEFQRATRKAIGLESTIPPGSELGGDTLVGRLMDVLSRGEFASAGLARDYLAGKDFNIDTAIKGFKGEEKVTYDQLVDVVFPAWSTPKRKAMGFALAIFGDPTTFIPAKAPVAATQQIKKIPGVKKGIKALEESTLGKAFVPGAGLPKEFYEKKYYAKKELEAKNQIIREDIENLRSGLNKDEMEELSYYREHPDEIDMLSPRLQEKLEEVGQKFDDLIDDAVENEIITPDVAQKWREREIPYLPHYYPERGIKVAKGEIPPSVLEKTKKPSFLKARKFETLDDAELLSNNFAEIAKAKTEKEAREIIEKYGIGDAFGKGQISNFDELKDVADKYAKLYTPDKNILRAYGIRASEQMGYSARKKFVSDVLSNPKFAKRIKWDTKVVPEGYGIYLPKGSLRFFKQDSLTADVVDKLLKEHGEMIPAEELIDKFKQYPSISKKVQTYMMPKAIAKDMNRMDKFFIGDPATNKMLRSFDKVQNAWKTMATTVRLPFHLRNMYSNMWQAYLSGVNNPRRFVQALEMQSGLRKGKTIKLGKKTFKVDDIKNGIDRLGIHGKGWIGSDIQKGQLQEIESIIKYGKFRKFNPVNAGRAFGSAVEDNARIAVFLDQLAKGKTAHQASKAVRKYLFDYTELTPFERNVAKRVFPFYTWSRKNIPLQIENLVKQPRKYQAWTKGMRAFEDPETEQERKMRPEYFNQLLYTKSPFKTKKGKPIYMNIDLPPLEFNRMLEVRHWVSSLTPVKLAAELGLNFKTFPELSKIKEVGSEMTRAPFWASWLPENMMRAMKDKGIIDQIRNKRNGKIELAMDKSWVHAFNSSLPFLNELNRIYAQPITLEDESPHMKIRSYLSGIGHKEMDLGLGRERQMYQRMDYQKALKKFMKQRGRAPSKKEMKRIEKQLGR